MRVRVPVAVRNRLLRIEARRPVNLPVGGWPPLMDLDVWEMLASCMQDELAASAYEDTQPVHAAAPLYEPQRVRKADEEKGGERAPSAIEEYLEARRNSREAIQAAVERSVRARSVTVTDILR